MTTARRRILTASLLVLGAAGFLALADGARETMQQVLVTNFPEVYRVHGDVGIRGPVRLAERVSFPETLVSPVQPTTTTRLIDGGILEGQGFSSVVLSLAVEAKGELARPGKVGAILVPEEDLTVRAFREDGRVLFPLEVEAALEPGESYFASNQPVYTLGFARYRIYYYNTTDKSVSVTLFGYLGAR